MINPNTTAWYLRCKASDVAENAVLVGDRGRALLAAEMLQDATVLNEDRGLTTVTGTWKGTRITVSAFGMGAPIAAVVVHELAALGVKNFVRLGTALSVGETKLGDLVLADSAFMGDGVSRTYVDSGFPAAPDLEITRILGEEANKAGHNLVTGLVASFDGFYTQMFCHEDMPGSSAVSNDALADMGAIGVDMETAAILVVGRKLGVRAASLCLASVDYYDHSILDPAIRKSFEKQLLEVGFNSFVTLNN